MEVGINASICDQLTHDVARALHPLFKELGERLQGEYGGAMEHLWINLELIASHARADGRPRHPFRFQKRVSGRSRLGLPAIPDWFNVGHFSVRPDLQERMVPYVLSLIYDGTAVLLEKQKKLGGFDAPLFRSRFLDACRQLGYEVAGESA